MTRMPLIAAALAALATLADAQSVTRLTEFLVTDVRETSEIDVVGRKGDPARWRESSGLTTYPGARNFTAVNPFGLTYAGNATVNGALAAMRFNIIGGWTPLPAPPTGWPDYNVSSTFDISDDGVDVVGFATFVGAPFDSHGFRWSSVTGLHFLTTHGSGEESFANAISGDGQRIVGRWSDGSGDQAVSWDTSGALTILLPPGFAEPGPSGARATNSDGSVIAGYTNLRAFLWSEVTGPTKLPTHPELTAGMVPHGVSDDGTVVVGTNGFSGSPSWIWTQGQGTRLIRDVAAQLQLPVGPAAEPYAMVEACTLDGLRIVGQEDSGGAFATNTSWILDLPVDGVGLWIDRGAQLPGTTSPTLNGFGSLGPDTPGTLSSKGLLPFSTVTLVVGFSDVDAPFKGGVLVPAPDLLFTLPTSLFGTVTLPFSWPAGGIPSGTSFFFQGWTPDALGPKGFAATNALEAITP